MNILWLSHILPYPPIGGVAQRSYHLIRELARHHSVDLLSFNQRAVIPTDEMLQDAIRHFADFCADVTAVAIPCDQSRWGKPILGARSLLTRDPYTINWLKSVQMENELRSRLSRANYDLVLFDTISLACYRHLVIGPKTILDHHNIETDMMWRRAACEPNIAKKLYFAQEAAKLHIYEKRLRPTFDMHITCSDLDSRRLLKSVPGLRTRSIPNPVDTDYFIPGTCAPQPNTIVFVGSMGWYPNREAMTRFAAKIWPVLRAAIPDVTMTVVGSDPPEVLQDLAASDDRFVVTGFVDDARPYIARSAVYVCPITNGGGTRLKVLDALAMGKAIIADPIACEGIDLVDGESVLYASNAEEYASQVKRLFADEVLRHRLGKNGRILIEAEYSASKVGRMLAAACEELVASPHDEGLQRNCQ